MSRFSTPNSYLLKLQRSKEHRDTVEKLVRHHLDARKAEFIHGEINVENGDVYVSCPDLDFDPSIFLAAADCLVNVRASLDHIVCQIAVENGVPITKQAFPICDKLDEFNECIGKGMLKGVPFAAITLMEAQQPYDRITGVRDDSHPLFALRELSNTDKHRAVYFASPDLRDLEMTVTDGSGQTATFTAPGPFRPGDVQKIGSLPFKSDGARMKIGFRGVNRITYEEFPVRGVVVTKLLTGIIDHVELKVLPILKPFTQANHGKSGRASEDAKP